MSDLSSPAPETPAPAPPVKRLTRIGNFRSSVAQFLAALILMLAVSPFLDEFKHGADIDRGLITLVLILGVLAVGRSHRTLAWAMMLMLPALLAGWINHFQPALLPATVHNGASLAFLCFVEYQLLHFIIRAPRVNSEVLCAGISGYLLLGILWMSAYMLVSRLSPTDLTHPGAFAFTVGVTSPHPLSEFEAYYFSFITLSTVGYGDITPISPGARTLAMLEAMTGTLYMAVLISRLVALYSAQRPEAPERKD